jgi:hypothetical protein
MTPSDRLKYCPERGRLLDLLNRTTIDYSRPVSILSERMGVLSDAQYQQMRAEVDRKRVDAGERTRCFYRTPDRTRLLGAVQSGWTKNGDNQSGPRSAGKPGLLAEFRPLPPEGVGCGANQPSVL